MICEKCASEIEMITCKRCNKDLLPLGDYCYFCGGYLKEKNDEEEEPVDLSTRILCSDGTCIGVVENGVCKLCGKPYVPEE
ncbi:MAG: hypothetical protein N2596_05475 [Syntrophorhabdaceae bacterium]|nr:hypothetical protein [Syntrophorhabdaceae bacterium]